MDPAGKLDSVSSPELASAKPTMLVVDDEEGPRQSLRVLFKDEFQVLLASDGATGIELAKAYPIDVAVLDIRMQGMSGVEVLERLKFLDPTIEVVMMTAFETADTMKQALRLRACDYINKPFEIATMRAAVATAMERRSLASATRVNAEKLGALQKELDQQRLEEEIVRDRGEIYASIIHDINGPLTIISGLIQIINSRIGDATNLEGEGLEMVKDKLNRITRQVTNCIDISRRYLGFLRQNPNESVRVWVNQILFDIREFLRVHPAVRNNELIIHPLSEDVSASINGTDLIQIITNLTLNALQCTQQPHRVEITGKLVQNFDAESIADGPNDRFLNREAVAGVSPLLTLCIKDTGPGIPPEIVGRIFDTYFTTRARSQGTGLGLSIVQRLVKQAHGALHLHTKVGEGTTFTVYLQARQQGNTDLSFKP